MHGTATYKELISTREEEDYERDLDYDEK